MLDGEDITNLSPQDRVGKGHGFRSTNKQCISLNVSRGKP